MSGSPERMMEEGEASSADPNSPTAPDTKNMHLYNVLGIDKKATDDEIKKAYRKLALRYHPDKNLDGDPEKTEKFKEINYANAIISNPKKRKIYDEMGETGLKLVEQFGEDNEKLLTWMLKPWFKYVFFGFGLITCGFFCCCCGCMCCCKCCCNFCCGKYTPVVPDEYRASGDDDLADPGAVDGDAPPVIVIQPGADSSAGSSAMPMPPPSSEQSSRPAVIAMPPPPSSSSTQDYGTIESSH